MDELVIGEKKYVSSKQAAKITGYAKDYVGQLCREGRVSARLVGRNWYVLESAINDHRFGLPKSEEVKIESVSVESPTSQSPRYEAVSIDDILPRADSSRQDIETTVPSSKEPMSDFSQHLQESWKEWFENVVETKSVLPAMSNAQQGDDKDEIEAQENPIREPGIEMDQAEPGENDKEVNIAVHTAYRKPPEELLPRYTGEDNMMKEEEVKQDVVRGEVWGIMRPIQIAGGVLAMFLAICAVIGSGYLDRYIISNSQVDIISGVILYNK